MIRNTIDSRAPLLGRVYREVRDEKIRGKRQSTSFGCELVSPPSMAEGNWRDYEIDVFGQCLESCNTCIDIGANIGFYTCFAASKGKHVIAIEPLAGNLKFLYENLRTNGLWSVEVYPLGLSGEPGLKPIYGTAQTASFVRGWNDATEETLCSVAPVSTLDILAAGRRDLLPLMIKLDVEGFECEVLKGATHILELDPKPVWLVEVLLNDSAIPGRINPRFQQVFDTFWQHGYQAKEAALSGRPVTPERIQQWVTESRVDSGSTNFVFSAK